MWGDQEYRTVVLAALLHDIGKLFQRGDFASYDLERQKHQEFSAEFISAFKDFFAAQRTDVDLLQTLVLRHHSGSYLPPELQAQKTLNPYHRALALLVAEADHLSAAERDHSPDRLYSDYRLTPLTSIFKTLEMHGKSHEGVAYLHAVPVADLDSLSQAVPAADFAQYAPGELNKLITDFGGKFKTVSSTFTSEFPALLSHLQNLLQQFAWCVPSDTQEMEARDISLYDHLRTTCAIAACLYQYHHAKSSQALEDAMQHPTDEQEFLLAAGDVSGIQSYIFDISRIGEGGVARRLRARSLMVQLFTEVAAREILARLALPQACEIMAAGGNFYLLLPNTRKARDTLDQVAREIDGWCLKELHGELALNLTWVEMGRQEFQGGSDEADNKGQSFGGILQRVNGELQKHKRRRFTGSLAKGSGWRRASLTQDGKPLDAFLLDVHYQGERVCGACRKFPSALGDPENLCELCRTDRDTGRKLPEARIIRLSHSNALPIRLPCGWSADIGPHNTDLAVSDIVVQLNSYDLADYDHWEASARFIANHVPTKTNEQGETVPCTFDDIAANAQGRKMLGFLKMDVDNLGELMVFGLRRSQGEHRDTISRIMTLSRSLDAFFSGWVQRLLEEDFSLCYAIFSGGDDLFVVGPWDRVLELAGRVRENFRKWVARDDVTISAGVVFTHPHYPISRSASDVEEELEASKHTEGKDCITFLGHTMTWQEWEALSQRWKKVDGWCNGGQVSTAFRYSLLEYGRMWQRYDRWRKDISTPKSDPGGVLGLRLQPLLAYNISRNLDQRKAPELYAWAEGFTRPQPGWTAQQRLEIQHLEVLAQLLIMGQKKEGTK